MSEPSSNAETGKMRSRNDSDGRLLKTFAPHDLTSSLAYVIGFRDWAYRQRAVDVLRLAKGDRVVEIGCGTGRNFALLERAVGPGGAIIAVDLSESMLARAQERAARNGWSNIELVQSDAATYRFPIAVDGVLSTYALVVIPEYDRVIERACQAMKEGKRCVVLDQKLPSGPASRLVPLLDLLSRPFDYSRIVGERRLWESIGRHAGNVRIEEFYFGFVYLAVGEKNAASADSVVGVGGAAADPPRRDCLMHARAPPKKPLNLTAAGLGQSCGFSPTRGMVGFRAAAA